MRYAQPRHGFRSGIEPVLLAASVPGRAGQRVLEAGCGAGAGLLCLAARIAGIAGVGIERDVALAALARRNAATNGFAALDIRAGAIEDLRRESPFDHAFANPPYHPPGGTRSPLAARDTAKRADPGLPAAWAVAMAAALRPGGTLTTILPAAAAPTWLRALTDADCAPVALLPLWPRAGEPAKLVLLRGAKGGAGALRLWPGLVLHAGGGGFTAEAEAVLRAGAALAL